MTVTADPGRPGGRARGTVRRHRGGRLRCFLRLVLPFFIGRAGRAAALKFTLAFGLAIAAVWIGFERNLWNQTFFGALERRDAEAVFRATLDWIWLLARLVGVSVQRAYLERMVEIEWRTWLTRRLLDRWLGRGGLWRLESAGRIDNPDQRVAEDARLLSSLTVELTLRVLLDVVELGLYIGVLWHLSGTLALPLPGGARLDLPGYMVIAAVVYAGIANLVAHRLGRPLAGLAAQQQHREADFRFGLARLRDAAIEVALLRGGRREAGLAAGRFEAVRLNALDLARRHRIYALFQTPFSYTVLNISMFVTAPAYLAGQLDLGGMMQARGAFSTVVASFATLVFVYPKVAELMAVLSRLEAFEQALADRPPHLCPHPAGRAAAADALVLEGVAVTTPDGQPLTRPIDLVLRPGEKIALTGASGTGKSLLLSAIAGAWPHVTGRIDRPRAGWPPVVVPQRPYLPGLALGAALLYPADGDLPDSRAQAAQLLEAVGLGRLIADLDGPARDWDRLLSPGERQRLALVRALLRRPRWLLIDEATSALDAEAETRVLALIDRMHPPPAVLMVAHRPAAIAACDRAIGLHAAADAPPDQAPA
jgi:putative ATP-binding cassette transporter